MKKENNNPLLKDKFKVKRPAIVNKLFIEQVKSIKRKGKVRLKGGDLIEKLHELEETVEKSKRILAEIYDNEFHYHLKPGRRVIIGQGGSRNRSSNLSHHE